MKKIWLFCLCLAILSLVWCFHVPDKDWLPSKNKVNTWSTQKDDEIDQALNDIMEWINMFSSDWNELKNEENNEINTEELENTEVENEAINDEIENEEVENVVVEEIFPYEE